MVLLPRTNESCVPVLVNLGSEGSDSSFFSYCAASSSQQVPSFHHLQGFIDLGPFIGTVSPD
jgi:hypothetical protein